MHRGHVEEIQKALDTLRLGYMASPIPEVADVQLAVNIEVASFGDVINPAAVINVLHEAAKNNRDFPHLVRAGLLPHCMVFEDATMAIAPW
ncbi:MAG: hypothetical protein JWO47_405 [Candidatus Saccharibacteria bacterium]|nr:hypothetical protein [Candidatus Saccharibacteria bacterium]